jgi:hypothetical protein
MPPSISALRTVGTFLNGRACSDTLFVVLDRAFATSSQDGKRSPEEKASMLMAGGILQHGYQCGALWGATLAAGAQVFRCAGSGPQAEAQAILAAKALVAAFREQNGSIDCSDLTEPELVSSWRLIKFFLLKGGFVRCQLLVARFAPLAFRAVKAALAEKPATVARAGPVSCAALLARKMGASEEQAMMAAGFAGGIGLCGDGCGALAAALWMLGMKALGTAGKLEFRNPQALALIDKFLRAANHSFECSEIVGRKFESIEDHARHVQSGGCASLIDALAGQ